MQKRVYEIDGDNFSTLEEFAAEFSNKLQLDIRWRGNLDAFNDILHGGFGTPDEGFVLVWKNSELSKKRLGYQEMIKWLEACLPTCHPSNIEPIKQRLELARQNKGQTMFDMLIEIITDEEHDDVELILA
jgi:RNAse (barnase) inhibitor barstar